MTKPLLIVVDDEPAIGEIFSFIAERIDVELQVAVSGAGFKDLLKDYRPDVVCMDLVMPETSANELISWMAEHDVKAPVLLMSGYTEADIDELRENAKSVGVPISGFLNKPFSLDDAVTCLKKALAA
ncbi:MAG: response regulator [Alphaproteobacteria bacterium]|nr:response regulator [Alphaproteobacteria bacterium]